MITHEADLTAMIGALDLVTSEEPAERWKPTVTALQAELAAAQKVERAFRPAGVITGGAAFFAFEWSHLDQLELFLAVGAATSILAMLVPAFHSARGGLAGLGGLAATALHFMQPLYTYLMIGLLTTIAAHWILEKVYPALAHRDRLTALFAYFEPNPVSHDAPA